MRKQHFKNVELHPGMGCLSPLLSVYFSSPLYVKGASREAPTASISVIFVMLKILIWVEVSKTKTERE